MLCKLRNIFKKSEGKKLLPPPVRVAHGEYSMILSLHDDTPPTSQLIDLSLQAISESRYIDLSFISKRMKTPPYYPNIWPGEHYKLLAAFIKVLQPEQVIEIGTSTGLSMLALQIFLKGKLTTFDIRPWASYPDTALTEEDKVEQIVADLSEEATFFQHQKLLQKAELVFIDATHDGKLETKLLSLFTGLSFTKPCYIILDDIRVWTMLKAWRDISLPKLDLTSFGHWSGTGIIAL